MLLFSPTTMNPRRHAFALLTGLGLFAAWSPSVFAEPLSLKVGTVNVQATAISPSTFRISINDGHPATPIDSVYLDPALKAGDVGKLVQAGGHQQLTTAMGTLDIDSAAGTMSLLDAHGQVLVPAAPIVIPVSAVAVSPSGKGVALNLGLGWAGDQPFSVYGCGNGADTLLQKSVAAHVNNGIAVEPYFWSPKGFASFVVGGDANAPATCDGTVQNNAITWVVPGSSADLYLMVAPTLSDSSKDLLELTGKPPVPPLWAFGYLQSRWGWRDRAYVSDALQQFTSRKLPVDAFIFDFEWYTKFPDYQVKPAGVSDFADFGWNPNVFPDPAAQLKELHDAGVHFVGIRKPRLGNADTLALVRSKGWNIQGGGEQFNDRDLRFDLPALRDWYAAQTQPLLQTGVDGWWDDEGEYTFTTYTNWNRAERQALDAVHPGARLWTICRAFQPGTSRLGAAAWTGDIHASWDAFQKTPTALLNWSLAGMPYCGCDIGGFSGETNPELLVRWMQAGTFFPVMRAHSEITVRPHFPWLFGDQAEAAIQKTLDLRYQLVPTLYSLAHENAATGEPLMRPLVMQYPTDPAVADLSSEWLVGSNLLVAPVLEPGGHRSVYLPNDIWYDFATGQRVAGGTTIDQTVPFDAMPLYVRGGSILPLAPVVQHTRDLPGGPLDLQVYPGQDGHFTLTEDDGSTDAYTTGNLRRTTFDWNDATKTLSWKQTGPYDGPNCFRSLRVTIRGGAGPSAEQPLAASGSVTAQQ